MGPVVEGEKESLKNHWGLVLTIHPIHDRDRVLYLFPGLSLYRALGPGLAASRPIRTDSELQKEEDTS
jgi:hypothetical protein